MPTHITVRVGRQAKRDRPKHEADHAPAGWSKHREPLIEKSMSSLTAGAGHDKWAQRAEANSGAKVAPGIGTKKSSQ